jgi:type II secretory pathway pseudopilin PulG
MLILAKLLFDNPLAKIGAAVVALLSLVGLYSWQQQSVGATKERAKIERKANEHIRQAEAVRDAVERHDPAGVLDPYANR